MNVKTSWVKVVGTDVNTTDRIMQNVVGLDVQREIGKYWLRNDLPIEMSAVGTDQLHMSMKYTGTIKVDWGDGTNTSLIGLGPTYQIFNKTYPPLGFQGTIKISGDLSNVTDFSSTANTGIHLNITELKKFTSIQNIILAGRIYIRNLASEVPVLNPPLDLSGCPSAIII